MRGPTAVSFAEARAQARASQDTGLLDVLALVRPRRRDCGQSRQRRHAGGRGGCCQRRRLASAAGTTCEPQAPVPPHPLLGPGLQGVIGAGLVRSWAVLGPADVAFLAAYGAASAGMLWWRRCHPASFARWRAPLAAVMRVAVAAAPTGSTVTRQALGAATQYGSSRVWNAAVYALTIAFCSFGATATALVSEQLLHSHCQARLGGSCMRCLPCKLYAVHHRDREPPCVTPPAAPLCLALPPFAAQALARPICLRLHLPAQAATMLLIASRNTNICSTPALRHPAAQQAAAGVYASLCALLGLLPMPAAAPAGLPLWHSPLGQCRAVLGMAELALGFLAPTLVLAAAESGIYRRYAHQWQAAQRQLEGTGQGAGRPAGTASAAAAGASSSRRDSDTGSTGRLPQAAAHQQPQPQQQGSVLHSGELKPPSRVEAGAYRCLHAILHPVDAADWTTTWLINLLLFGAAWQIVLLLTPP